MIVAVIAVIAIVSNGYRAERLDLGDGAVWVVNEARQAIGRANTQILQLNSAVESTSSRLDVRQSADAVLLVDRGSSAVNIVDPATATVAESVPLPPGDAEVWLVGDQVVIASDGDLWLVPMADLPDFNAESDPTLTLGSGAITSVNPDGDIFVYSPESGDISRIAAGSETVSGTTRAVTADSADGFQLSSLGDQPLLLDQNAGELHIGTMVVALPAAAGGGIVIQQPAESGNTVYLAYEGGLIRVPVGGGTVSSLVERVDGAAAAPLYRDGCLYAAWTDGTVYRDCDGTVLQSELDGIDGDARLGYLVNGDHVVLNDAAGGASWAVQAENQLIDNWDDLIDPDDEEQQLEENDEDIPPEFEQTQQPPVAVDDELGARPGKTSTLPVLMNDFDPNGDVLMISQFGSIDESMGRIELVNNAQQLQVTLDPAASGQLSFDYTITDGRGGTATATVALTVRSPSDNAPPAQFRATKASVASGGRLSTQVLGDWYDPDGDPFYLTDVQAAAPDQAQFTPDGTVIYTDAGQGGELKQLGVTVSDGSAAGTGTLTVTVSAFGEVPIIAEPFGAVAYAGEEIEISPLLHVRGGSGPLRLTGVPAKTGATITPDYDGGTFRFTSSEVRTHQLEYAVTDGSKTTTGVIRVEVIAPPEAGAKPVTVPHTVFIRQLSNELVDVLAGDFDPAGGVLVVTGVSAVPQDAGVRVEIIEQRALRVTLTAPQSGPVSFNYTVSNGVSEATGTVTAIEIPNPANRQPPVAFPDSISVRTGDAIDIPVLANDIHPDGDPLSLAAELSSPLDNGAGLLFTSGRVLRYLAPDKPGNYTAVYRALAPDGQWADAQVTINVREIDAASNAAPVPRTVIARVLSGERVRIQIPLSGIDPDGDSVQLIGQSSNPEKGAVTDSGRDWFDYEAGAYSTGTDTFSYTVVDALGKQATGTVRVGISPKLEGSRVPVASPDEVVTRPDRTVAVQVLANDSDPDGGLLSITSVEPTADGAVAVIDGDLVRVTVPPGDGRYGFIYEIQNKWGNTSSNFITVIAREDAPLARPLAADTVLTLADILDRTTVDVNVLSNVFFADGAVSELGVSLPSGFGDDAQVLSNKRVRVTISNHSQIIPFEVSHPDDPAINATAFIWVPGYDDALPQLRPSAKPITVKSGERISIDINDYVVATGKKPVRLTDAATVRATHANGDNLVASDDTLVFTSADKYFGPASISFEVTDGDSASDPDGRVATLVLPIEVTPRENQPPVFTGGAIDFEPGQERTIELVKLTSYPYAGDSDELRYTVLDPQPAGFSARIDGQKLVLTADDDLARGAAPSVLIGVRDTVNEGTAGRIHLTVVPSTRPLAVPAPDTAIAKRSTSTVVNVLENDQVTNPFPDTPLRVVAVRGLDGANLPAGVTVTPSNNNSRLTVAVSSTADAIDTTLQYQVADATGDPSRYAWGTVFISVQDRPSPVTNVRVTGFADRTISLAWEPGAFNNSPITGFEVSRTLVSTGAALSPVSCATTTCQIPTPGNGSANALRLQVVAKNAIGTSDPQALGDPVWSDVIPAAPTGLTAAPLDGSLLLGWDQVPNPGQGSAVSSYAITVGGVPRGQVSGNCSGGRCQSTVNGLQNGTAVEFTISARNDAYPALSTWNQASGQGTPYGKPAAGGIAVNGNPVTAQATVSWDAFNGNGDAIVGYYVQRLDTAVVPSGGRACSVSSPAPGTVSPPAGGGNSVEIRSVGGGSTSVTFDGLDDNDTEYYFAVWGYNRAGCAVTGVASAVIRTTPAPITSVNGEMRMREDGTVSDYFVTGTNPGGVDDFQVRSIDAGGAATSGWQNFGASGTGFPSDVLGRNYGQPQRFEIRGCTIWGALRLCGDPLAKTAPAPTLTLLPDSLVYDQSTGAFSWTADPGNGAAYLPSYSCGVESDPSITGTIGTNSCVLSAPTAAVAWLDVTVHGIVKRYYRP